MDCKTFTHPERFFSRLDNLEVITHDDGRRFYKTPAGVWYPSVTTVCSETKKKVLKEWKARVGAEEASRVSSKASARGNRIHKLCEYYIDNKLNDMADEIRFDDLDMFKSIKKYVDKIDNVLIQEAPLYSDFLEVAGRVDCIAEYNGRLSIIDFKTSLREKKRDWIQNYFMQEACYAVCFEERTGIPITNLVTIIAVDNGNPQVFIEKRDDYIFEFICVRKRYKEKYGQ